jgi:coproporphyrinogen III oxidase
MKILDFVKEMKEKAVGDLLEVSGTGKCDEKSFDFDNNRAIIATIRGGAIGKAAITQLMLKGVTMPDTGEEVDATVYQMEVFPENPYCPMGHFNTEWSTKAGVNTYHMNLDLFPAITVEEDLAAVKGAMDKVADQFGRDRDGMRKGLDEHYNMGHWSVPLATKVGCKLLKLGEADLELFVAAYRTFFDGYIAILKKRKDAPFSEEEGRLTGERNGKWLEYITLKDRAIRMAQARGMPPEILIGLAYPPFALL